SGSAGGSIEITHAVMGEQQLEKATITGKPVIATLRAKAFAKAAPDTGKSAQVETGTPTINEGDIKNKLIEITQEGSQDAKKLEDAEVVVSGGRGLKSPEGFAMLEELAKLLGGSVGATRAVTDAGWRPHSEQIGQTGKTVSPQLYLALGISGQI